MGTIPVANPSPMRKPRFRREVAIIGALLSVVGTLAVVAVFVWPTGSKVDRAGWVTVGNADDIPLWQPVFNAEHRFWLVKLGDQTFLALSRRDPHLGCSIPWNPDFELMGRKGWFRNPCHDETYNLNGECVFGPCIRGMDRFPV